MSKAPAAANGSKVDAMRHQREAQHAPQTEKEFNVGDIVISIEEILKPLNSQLELIDGDISKLKAKREMIEDKIIMVQKEIGKRLGFSTPTPAAPRTRKPNGTATPFAKSDDEVVAAVKAIVKDDAKAGRGLIAQKLGVEADIALSAALNKLVEAKTLKKDGAGKGTNYTVA